LSGKEFLEDGAATANTWLARCLCVLGIKKKNKNLMTVKSKSFKYKRTNN